MLTFLCIIITKREREHQQQPEHEKQEKNSIGLHNALLYSFFFKAMSSSQHKLANASPFVVPKKQPPSLWIIWCRTSMQKGYDMSNFCKPNKFRHMWRPQLRCDALILQAWNGWRVRMVGRSCRWKFTKTKKKGPKTPWLAVTRKKIFCTTSSYLEHVVHVNKFEGLEINFQGLCPWLIKVPMQLTLNIVVFTNKTHPCGY